MSLVAVLAFDGVVAFDLMLSAETFSTVRLANGSPAYEVRICGAGRSAVSTMCRLDVRFGLQTLDSAETVIVPGIDRAEREVDERILRAIRRAAARGARVASMCSGALVLARTGLLSGKRATTHWAAAKVLQAHFPDIVVDPNVLYIDHGNLLTSAGGIAQLDMCLHMIRRDYGSSVAAAAARLAVMPLERSGGQAQFVVRELPSPDSTESLSGTLEWMRSNLRSDLSVPALARRAAMSERSFARRFVEQTGMTPAKWVTQARVRLAQELLETTSLTMDGVADAAGFGSTVNFRTRFLQLVGVSPAAYRKSFPARNAPGVDGPSIAGSLGAATLPAA